MFIHKFNKYFESKRITNVDKKIQFLKDLFLDLEDIGLKVEVYCYNPSHHGSFIKSEHLIAIEITDNNNLMSNEQEKFYELKIIKDKIERLKTFGIKYRAFSGWDNKVMIFFDRYNNSIPKNLIN